MSAPADPTKPGVQITGNGIDVADGTLIRATLGLLPDGSYGLGMFDQYGQNLLNVEGFGPSWAALIQSGVYNNVFSEAIPSIYYAGAMRGLFFSANVNGVAYFKLGEPSGITATDSSPTANNGTYFNAPTLGVQGPLINDSSTAVTFLVASLQYMEAPLSAAYAFGTGSYTLTCWFKYSALPVANEFLINMNGATTNGFEMFIDSNGLLNSRIGAVTVQSAALAPDNQWHFLAVTMDRAGNGQYYIDGLPSGAAVDITPAAAQNIAAAVLDIARLSGGTNYLDGSLSQVAVFSGLLTAIEIAYLYSVGSATGIGQTLLPVGTSNTDPAGTSAGLPFWSVWASSGSGTATVVQDPESPGGNRVDLTYSATGTATSNNVVLTTAPFPVESLMTYRPVFAVAGNIPAGVTVGIDGSMIFYDASGNPLLPVEGFSNQTLTAGTGSFLIYPIGVTPGIGDQLPVNARLRRLEFATYEVIGHSASTALSFGLVSTIPEYDGNVHANGTVAATTGSFSNLTATSGGVTQSLTVGYHIALAGSISPALTGNANDWSPTGLATATGIYVAPTAVWHITGLDASVGGPNASGTGRIVYIYNNSAFDLFLDTFSGSSAAGNIFVAPSQVRIPSAGTVWLVRAQASGGWLVLPGTGTIPAVRSFYLPAAVATADAGTKTTIGATAQLVPVVALADAATQGCYWSFETPADFLSGDFTAQVVWAAGSTDANATHTVRWTYNALKFVQNTSAIAGTVATTFTGAATARTANFSYYDTGTLMGLARVANTSNRFEVQRIGADAADTYVGVVNVIGIIVTYLAKA